MIFVDVVNHRFFLNNTNKSRNYYILPVHDCFPHVQDLAFFTRYIRIELQFVDNDIVENKMKTT